VHEAGLASSILTAVQQEIQRYPRSHAVKVGIRIGEFAAVDPESLRFCFDALLHGHELEPMQLEIEWCCAENGWCGDELDIAYLELEYAQEAPT
jgi:hydrogenase nickel incorporation protein HypA/HybF